MDAGVAALLGAGLSGVLALAVQFLGSWMSGRASARQRQADRLALFLAATHGYVLAVGQVARAAPDAKESMESDLVWKYMDAINEQVAHIELQGPRPWSPRSSLSTGPARS